MNPQPAAALVNKPARCAPSPSPPLALAIALPRRLAGVQQPYAIDRRRSSIGSWDRMIEKIILRIVAVPIVSNPCCHSNQTVYSIVGGHRVSEHWKAGILLSETSPHLGSIWYFEYTKATSDQKV